MSILIKAVRVAGFRGLENIEVELEKITILTGANNAGKTSFLRALQLALGSHQFVSSDDFFIQSGVLSEIITVDVLIIPVDDDGKQCEEFPHIWEELFTTDRIRMDDKGNSFVPLRTIISFDVISNAYKAQQFILQKWPKLKLNGIDWFKIENGKKTSFYFDKILFFYINAQRDILEDIKLKNSFLGKMLSKIEYSKEDVQAIEKQIKLLNRKAIKSSDILFNLKETLKELDTTMGVDNEGVEITPFTKKIRDLGKGLTIHYADSQDSFSMEYHGMGTRSWSSLLTLKAFISLLARNAVKELSSVFFPVLAIEEPEAHLHPNAQKKLYEQVVTIPGQKIISTHSSCIAATAGLDQLRHLYKKTGRVSCGKISVEKLQKEDVRKIERQVVNTRGEIFFSKLIVFSEGETEEQALPVFARTYFKKRAFEMGLDFIGVGGHQYLPFLRFAEGLKISWIIFSDGEDRTVKKVEKQLSECGLQAVDERVVFLDKGNNFEAQLIADGFCGEIKKAIIQSEEYKNKQHREATESEKLQKIDELNDTDLCNLIKKDKTKYAPAIAESIISSDKEIPPKIMELFDKVKRLLGVQEMET